MSVEVPPGWQSARIGDRYSFTAKPEGLQCGVQERVAFIPMDLIPIARLHASDYVWKSPLEISSGTYFEEGDLLLSKITPCFENGKQGIAKEVPGGFGYATTEVIPIRGIDGDSDVSFLAYYLLQSHVRQRLAAKMEGATGRQRLPKSVLADWVISWPPLSEQRAISRILASVQAAMVIQEQKIATLRELKAATMTRLFREGLLGGEALRDTEIGEQPSSWRVEAVGTHFHVGNGSTPNRQNPGYWTGGSLPWLTSKRVHDTIIRAADEYVTNEAKRDCHLPLVPSGSLVIAITGQGKTLGNVAKVTFDTFVNQHLAYLKPTGTKVNLDFLLAYLQTRYQDLRRAASAGGSTKGALTCGFLAGYRFPLPPLHEQEQIAGLWRRLTDRLETADSRRASSVALFETALEALISGELRVTPLLGGG